ncbi:hypothetical protein NLU13_4316 [Sarocladium strictum]|uniref:Uncharacterized protein n=1 Tax=Sarocladium strictum TaxID=5046 RepID=A0AA39GIM9_SARSR|nr:hypothetical protein NLU13_4316 [Sarocladium strictum]
MASLKFYLYPGAGEFLRKVTGHSQAVRIGDRIEASGQGGWELVNDDLVFPQDIKAEIAKAFENVDTALKAAGGKGWSQVFRVNSYHTNLEDTELVTGAMKENFEKWMPDHAPLWTEIGVKRLGA